MTNSPMVLPHPESILPRVKSMGSLFVGGIWGAVTAGQNVMASDGMRFIWSVDPLNVIYYQKGKFYTQAAQAFAAEIRTAPFVEAGRRALFMARAAEAEMKLLTGILAGSGTAGFAIVIGTEVLGFVVENSDQFKTWQVQLSAVLKARKYLKLFAPTIYDKVFDAVLHRLYKDVKSKLPEAVTPDTISFGVGVIVGSVGKKVAQGKFSLLSLIWVIIEQLSVRFTLSVLPEAFTVTGTEYRKISGQIISKLREAGIVIHEADVKRMIEEVRLHPQEIKKAYQMLKEAFEKNLLVDI
jgi:hypothetical protein